MNRVAEPPTRGNPSRRPIMRSRQRHRRYRPAHPALWSSRPCCTTWGTSSPTWTRARSPREASMAGTRRGAPPSSVGTLARRWHGQSASTSPPSATCAPWSPATPTGSPRPPQGASCCRAARWSAARSTNTSAGLDGARRSPFDAGTRPRRSRACGCRTSLTTERSWRVASKGADACGRGLRILSRREGPQPRGQRGERRLRPAARRRGTRVPPERDPGRRGSRCARRRRGHRPPARARPGRT